MDAFAFGVSFQISANRYPLLGRTYPCKTRLFPINPSKLGPFLQRNWERRSSMIPSIVLDGSHRINLTQGSALDDEDDGDDDLGAEEYDEVERVHQNFVIDEGDGDSSDEFEIIDSVEEVQAPKDKWERVQELCAKVEANSSYNITARELASLYDFPVDKFQRLAIQAFLKGSSVVVCAPTSSGKTLIAEAAAAATVARGKRLFYTTPLKALSNQKFREFRETFGVNNVGLLTGDAAVNKEAPVLIMTTEILRNMLYRSVGTITEGSRLVKVDVVVLDEVHYLSDISRGTVWEETVIYCPKEVQLICLSATVANPEELAGWIGQVHGPTDLVTSKRRPVPLSWHFSMRKTLLPLLNEKATTMNRKLSIANFQQDGAETFSCQEDGTKRNNNRKGEKRWSNKKNGGCGHIPDFSEEQIQSIRRSHVPQVRDTLLHLRARNMLPAIWFIFSRRGCDVAVQYLEDSRLLDDHEQCEVESALKKFRDRYPDAVREDVVKYLRQGVAAHHAGCLPLWKSFIEELFQQGLLKVVFATETLAAGINMPARTTVLASLSKRGDNGHSLLSSNALLQMAGRAGRRGIDDQGHVVLVQTPFEGAEECCKLLFAGPDPLVSQFSASYGMVLNLLAGVKLTHKGQHSKDGKVIRAGRTLEEARRLIEQSFGNYVGSEVMMAAKEQLEKIQEEIGRLELEVSDQILYNDLKGRLSKEEFEEYMDLYEQLRIQKLQLKELRQRMEWEKVASLKPLLEESSKGQIHFICLQYSDEKTVDHFIPALYVGKVDSSSSIELESEMEERIQDNPNGNQESKLIRNTMHSPLDLSDLEEPTGISPSYYVALGSDNTWYLFSEKWVKTIYKSGLPDVPVIPGDDPTRLLIQKGLKEVNASWEKLAQSELGGLWCMEGSLDTWSWSLNIPLLSSLSDEDEMFQMSQAYLESQSIYKKHKKEVSILKTKMKNTQGFKEFQKLYAINNVKREKIERLKAKSNRIGARISQIEPTGWRDFLQVSKVLHEARALDINTQLLFPLGETASAIRGENELWLAMALRNKSLLDLKPAQLAAVCGSLVSEGIKVRPGKSDRYIYEASSTVNNVIEILEEQRGRLLQLQAKYKVEITCNVDIQFAGMIEAWASGLTWREITMECGMDDGDLARLLRRTIDLLAQMPQLPDIDHTVQKNAKLAADFMDRSPISELVG